MQKNTRGEVILINTKRPPKDTLIPGAIFTFIFSVWIILVTIQSNFIQTFDKTIINLVCNRNPANISFAKTFTVLGNTKTIVFETIVLVVLLLIFRQNIYALFTAATIAAANGFNWILKHVVQRPRPTVHHLVYADGYSFPSGHSVGSASLFGVFIILTLLLIRSGALKAILVIIWALFPLTIGYTRIFLHVHYPSDVVGGWLEGITFVLIAYSILYHYYIEPRMYEINNS